VDDNTVVLRSRSLRLFSFLLLLTASFAGVGPVGSNSANAASNWLNTQDRSAVVAAYESEFGSPSPSSGWNGDRSSCTPGTTSQEFRDAIFSRVNFFRSMAGVPAGITENPAWSAQAQEAALMMSASGRLSHSPDSSFACYTASGAQAAQSSDLYLGRTGPESITGYMEDPGSNNLRVGHRNWILHPTTNQMGTGDIPATGGWSSNTLWVFDNVFGAQPTLRESEGFVAWPPRGFVPGELVFPRWSVGIRNGDFSAATVSISQDGSPISSTVVHRDSAGNSAPFPILVWEPVGVNLHPTVDLTYRVTVDGARVGGNPASFSYDVVILGDTPAAGGISPAVYNDFVTRSFADFVGRNPTAGELEYWTQRLATGTTRFNFVQALAVSEAWTANVVDQLYIDTLGRPGDRSGSQYWISRLQTGSSVAQVAASFYGSREYVTLQGGTYDAWVVDLYGVLLDRSADNGGRSYWTGQAGSIGTGTVAYRFYQSRESREARVAAMYLQFLNRAPDAAGLAYWADVLKSGDDLRLAAVLASSNEYFAG
jgi:uncharacterized protein YkwD